MSLWTKVLRPAFRGALGLATGGASEQLYRTIRPQPRASVATPAMSPVASSGWEGAQQGGVMPGGSAMARLLPALPRAAGAVDRLAPLAGPGVGGARAAGYAAGRVAGAAAAWCRRNPAWCSTVGIAGIEAMLRSGQLPMTKRRRARGITGVELRAFRRVVRFTSKYCAPVHKAMKAPVMRKRAR